MNVSVSSLALFSLPINRDFAYVTQIEEKRLFFQMSLLMRRFLQDNESDNKSSFKYDSEPEFESKINKAPL